MLVISSFKRLIAALAFVLPVAALVASPVMAHSKARHHSSVHKASHKVHSQKAPTTTAG
jgi:hypothetical protein